MLVMLLYTNLNKNNFKKYFDLILGINGSSGFAAQEMKRFPLAEKWFSKAQQFAAFPGCSARLSVEHASNYPTDCIRTV